MTIMIGDDINVSDEVTIIVMDEVNCRGLYYFRLLIEIE
jgi:hypothetical protein